MTAILGYIADDIESNPLSMFLASDGLVVWHNEQGDTPQNDYKKVYRFKNFLISFNGEVQFYHEFLKSIKEITSEISCIWELQEAVNNIFQFDKFGNNLGGYSKARYSNIIILDIENRILAHHYAGNVSSDYDFPFNFKPLENNTLYHFGSIVSFINHVGNKNDAFFVESYDYLEQTLTKQIDSWEVRFKEVNSMVKGIGSLNSYYILEKNNKEHSSNIDNL